MHNRYADPDYAGTVAELKAELKKLRREVGDTDEGNERILRVNTDHWDD